MIVPAGWLARRGALGLRGHGQLPVIESRMAAAYFAGASSQTKCLVRTGCGLRPGLEEGEEGERAAADVWGLGQAEFHEAGAYVWLKVPGEGVRTAEALAQVLDQDIA
jgi:hypothetical protein